MLKRKASRVALETLYQDLSSSRDQMVLAEVEQLLLIAGQQLQLAGNVKAALIAMQQADSRLNRFDRAALAVCAAPLTTIWTSCAHCRCGCFSPQTHVSTNLISIVNRLPLLQDLRSTCNDVAPAALPADSSWQKLLREIWQDAKDLVRIEEYTQE